MKILAPITLAAFLASGFAYAQTPAPTTPPAAMTPAPATNAAKPAAKASDASSKKAVAKACSDQADTKGLHGKERKKFREDCKKSGGTAK
jgi:hypothetical protein